MGSSHKSVVPAWSTLSHRSSSCTPHWAPQQLLEMQHATCTGFSHQPDMRDKAPQAPRFMPVPGAAMGSQWPPEGSALGSILPVFFGGCSSPGPPTFSARPHLPRSDTTCCVPGGRLEGCPLDVGALCSFASVLLRGDLLRGIET